MEVVSAEAVALAVNAANALRQEFNEPLLDGLPPGVRGDEKECILARAFNFDCEVDGNLSEGWSVRFSPEHHRQAQVLAAGLGTEVLTKGGNYALPHYVELPGQVAEIASAFDEGRFGEDAE